MAEILVKTYTRHRDKQSKHFMRDWTAGDIIGCFPDGTLIGKDGNLKHTTMYLMNMVFKVDGDLPIEYAGGRTKDEDGKLLSRSSLIINLADVLTDQQLKDAMNHEIMNPIMDLKISYLDLLKDRIARTILSPYDKQGSIESGSYIINSGGTDYATVQAFESDFAATLTGDITGTITDAFDDTLGVTFDGVDHGIHTVKVTATGDGVRAEADWDATRYRMVKDDSGGLVDIVGANANNIWFDGIQLQSDDDSGSNIFDALESGTTGHKVSNCYVYGPNGNVGGIYFNSGSHQVWNTICWSPFNSQEGIYCASGAVQVDIYNCTINGFNDGIERDGSSVCNVYNTAVFDSENNFDGTFNNIEHCASDQGDDTGSNAVVPSDWDTVFENIATGDFRLKVTDTDLTNAGNGAAPVKTLFQDDIVGTARPVTDLDWDIGAFETPSAGGATAAVTGTIIDDSPTEEDIRTGGKTIILTLTDDTWVADVGDDHGATDDLIAGIDGDVVGGTGWDNEVKANMVYTDITREVDDVTVTILLQAEAGYDISATETVTVTIPATALTAAGEVVATPTFEITHVAAGAIINQLQQSNLGSDLFNGTLL